MKGLSQRLRDLVPGEQITVSDTERSDIYKTAKRVDVFVKIEKFAGGFYVTRAGDASPVRMQPARDVIREPDIIATPTPVVEPEPVEIVEWRFTKDAPNYADNGNVYRQQYLVSNPKKRRAVQVDSDDIETIQE